MQVKAKYVVVQVNPILEVALLCPPDAGVSHKQLAGGSKVLGAGFCRIDGPNVMAYGGSLGLQVESRGTPDADLIAKQFCGVEPAKVPV